MTDASGNSSVAWTVARAPLHIQLRQLSRDVGLITNFIGKLSDLLGFYVHSPHIDKVTSEMDAQAETDARAVAEAEAVRRQTVDFKHDHKSSEEEEEEESLEYIDDTGKFLLGILLVSFLTSFADSIFSADEPQASSSTPVRPQVPSSSADTAVAPSVDKLLDGMSGVQQSIGHLSSQFTSLTITVQDLGHTQSQLVRELGRDTVILAQSINLLVDLLSSAAVVRSNNAVTVPAVMQLPANTVVAAPVPPATSAVPVAAAPVVPVALEAPAVPIAAAAGAAVPIIPLAPPVVAPVVPVAPEAPVVPIAAAAGAAIPVIPMAPMVVPAPAPVVAAAAPGAAPTGPVLGAGAAAVIAPATLPGPWYWVTKGRETGVFRTWYVLCNVFHPFH
jgi:hypothetical protein